MAKLLSKELSAKNIAVLILHPGVLLALFSCAKAEQLSHHVKCTHAARLSRRGIHSLCMRRPGFNKTDMTKKYQEAWDREGAVDISVGAKRVLHEVSAGSMESSGKFINCEDGLHIPF